MSAQTARAALYLPAVEADLKPGVYRTLVEAARAAGAEYSKIWDLFAFQHDVTIHLARFTQGVLRQPATITPGMRELIAAYTSLQNGCGFCTQAHAAAAVELLGDEPLVRAALRDLDTSPLDEKHKHLLRFAGRLTVSPSEVGPDDIDTLRAAGWDDEAIYFAITTCALFNFYNRWVTASGVPEMSPEAHRRQGAALAARGYVRDRGPDTRD
jgi:uncharacterized peroxidase-related enzyme